MSLISHLILILALGTARLNVASFDIDITNGTCYYGAHKALSDIYSPAGNSVLGHTFCCRLGDKLNGHNVCVGITSDGPYTYIAGCTDPAYENDSCPYKGNYTSYKWVGLVPCLSYEDSFGGVPWVGCVNDGSEVISASPESRFCTCDLTGDDTDERLFHAGKGLDAWGWLPDEALGTISWFDGYPPSTVTPWMTNEPPTSSTTTGSPSTILPDPWQTSSDSSFTTSTSYSTPTLQPTVTNTVEPESFDLKNWSGNQKAGFGFGIAICSIIIIAVIVFLLRRCAKKQSFEVRGFKHCSPKPETTQTPALYLTPDMSSNISPVATGPGAAHELPADVPPHPGRLVCRSYTAESPGGTADQHKGSQQESPSRLFGLRSPTDELSSEIGSMPNDQRPPWAQTSRGYQSSNGRYSNGGLHEIYVQESLSHHPETIAELPG